MIGEIRDKETAEIAVTAALTGHLVLTTLHTRDASSAITRFYDMGIEPYRIAASLGGVVAQRLLRKICKNCRGSGCAIYKATGFYKRTGVFEVVTSDVPFQDKVSQIIPVAQLRKFLRDEGVRSLYKGALEKVRKNITTMEEVMRVIDYIEKEDSLEI
jgi:type II secretory ATPase GspE/PulE/Tfp pilus assembly ATPase PilB-like protein